MKRYFVSVLLTFVFALWSLNASATTKIVGVVTKVVTGDTIIVKSHSEEHEVRLGGIDAPEKGQHYWDQAKRLLETNIKDQQVTVIVVGHDYKKRKVGFVFLENININYFMVLSGNAWALRRTKRGVNYTEAEKTARENKEGIWAQPKEYIIHPTAWAKQNTKNPS